MSLDLTAVCKRHGIRTKRIKKWRVMIYQSGLELTPHERFASEEEAVCHGLKRRYEIGTNEFAPNYWGAGCSRGLGSGGHTTELAAVVALADRLHALTTEGKARDG